MIVPSPVPVLYLAIPAHNEVATIGVLLWRIRTVLAEFPREYEVVVYDDASTDATADVASQYEQAMPVSVIRGERHLGYAGAVDRLLRHVAQQTRYPRRDAVLLLQGDFTDPPGIVPEFARRFEGGADLVVGERMGVADAPVAVRRLFKAAQWAMRPFVRVEGVKDTTASMRLVRISALRDAIRAVGDAPLVTGDSWTTNADLLLRLAPHARRVEAVPMEPTYGVRMRETRRIALRDALSALKWAWGARGRRAVVGSNAEAAPEGDRRGGRGGAGKRREEAPELSVDRLREKIRERDGSRGIDGEPEKPRERKRGRDQNRDRDQARTERPAKAERPERTPRAEKPEQKSDRQGKPRRERPERTEAERAAAPRADSPAPADARPPKPPRGERPERPDRQPRPRPESRPTAASPLELDDPFAPPKPNVDPFARALDTRPASPIEEETESAFSESTGVVEERDSAAPRAAESRSLANRDADDASDDADDLDDSEEIGDDDGATGEAGEGDPSAPRRKRRRNRRSRRGRRRKEGANGEASEDGAADGGDSETGDSAASEDGGAPTRAPRLEGARVERPARDDNERDSETDGAEDGGDGDDTGDDDAEGGDDAAQNRARRRGRRGRRGGARRSRGRRDRPRGDGESGGEGGAGDGPPAGQSDGPAE